MSDPPAEYDAGVVEDYYWVECSVRLPGDRDEATGKIQDFTCLAKVQSADVIDALDLDRWTTQAFQYIWRSGRKRSEPKVKELAKAAWFLQRGFSMENHWQATLCDVVAAVLEGTLERFGSETLPLALSDLAKALRERDLDAVKMVAEAYGTELKRAGKTAPRVEL